MWTNRSGQSVLVKSEEDGGKVMLNSWINNVDRIRMKIDDGMSSATGPPEGRRRAVSKLERIVTVENNK